MRKIGKMGTIRCLTFCLLLNILLVAGQTYTSVINMESGPVRGLISTTIENKEYAAFLGIPYAKPPIGDLRFKPPVPVDAWTNVHNATTEGNVCIQLRLGISEPVFGSEDCLYLHVYTPHINFNNSASKPVMVWFHGTRFVFGDAGPSMYGPDFIVAEDVILVSFNHRLGAFGFLNLEHENATGNMALKDQNLVLKWVKSNIANFGGDPDKITIFGVSAGAACVDLQVVSDLSVGLFNQSISMSGSTLNLYWGIQRRTEALKNGFMLGAKLGTKTRSKDVLLKALYNASATDIITATKAIGYTPFRATVENPNIARDQEKFLTTCALAKYQKGNYTKGPHMMGFTKDEAVVYLGPIEDPFSMVKSALQWMKNATTNVPLLTGLTSGLADVTTRGIEKLSKKALHSLAEKLTDIMFVLGIDTKQRLISKNNNHPIYYYRFSFVSNYSLHKALYEVNLEGAAHVDDYPYIFYTPPAKLPLYQPDIAATRRRMVKLYTNFAKYGNPTPDGDDDDILGITWPDSRPNGVYLDIDRNLTIGPRPSSNLVKMLQWFGLGESRYLNDC